MKATLLLLLIVMTATATAQTKGVIEIRQYNLKPGTREFFHHLFLEQCMPMLRRWNVHVLAYGPSLHDTDSYFLVRGFESVGQREKAEDAFYSSDEWKKGPRETVLAQIISYTTIVVPDDSVGRWVTRMVSGENWFPDGADRASDSARLSALNKQFILNFIHEDVKAHNEIIHPNFVCIESDGSVVNREAYMKNWATDFGRGGYQSFDYTDETIRVFHDMALVSARTVYTKTIGGKQVTGHSVYTDTYVKEGGQWKCVQAQITPVR